MICSVGWVSSVGNLGVAILINVGVRRERRGGVVPCTTQDTAPAVCAVETVERDVHRGYLVILPEYSKIHQCAAARKYKARTCESCSSFIELHLYPALALTVVHVIYILLCLNLKAILDVDSAILVTYMRVEDMFGVENLGDENCIAQVRVRRNFDWFGPVQRLLQY
ncbi:unnamed protein product [Arctia plantaginis]|uniref:Uncharacterized protein n=1 Tax=Arctia plantaginis TaxID=874455 RepID=A0A8S1BKB0_ARCPL|nr:unnamed protein product [Arctia plantaginis]